MLLLCVIIKKILFYNKKKEYALPMDEFKRKIKKYEDQHGRSVKLRRQFNTLVGGARAKQTARHRRSSSTTDDKPNTKHTTINGIRATFFNGTAGSTHYLYNTPIWVTNSRYWSRTPTYVGKYLKGYTKTTKNTKFTEWVDAVHACVKDPDAGGITVSFKSNKTPVYTVRRGTVLLDSVLVRKEDSWLKSDVSRRDWLNAIQKDVNGIQPFTKRPSSLVPPVSSDKRKRVSDLFDDEAESEDEEHEEPVKKRTTVSGDDEEDYKQLFGENSDSDDDDDEDVSDDALHEKKKARNKRKARRSIRKIKRVKQNEYWKNEAIKKQKRLMERRRKKNENKLLEKHGIVEMKDRHITHFKCPITSIPFYTTTQQEGIVDEFGDLEEIPVTPVYTGPTAPVRSTSTCPHVFSRNGIENYLKIRIRDRQPVYDDTTNRVIGFQTADHYKTAIDIHKHSTEFINTKCPMPGCPSHVYVTENDPHSGTRPGTFLSNMIVPIERDEPYFKEMIRAIEAEQTRLRVHD